MKSYLIWVFAGDPSSYDMSPGARQTDRILKAYYGVTPGCFSIKQTDILDSIKRDAHCDLQGVTNTPLRLRTNPFRFFLVLLTAVHLKLGGWKVDVHNHFRTGMFHLQTRIQLQKVEPSIFREEVFHSPCTHVAHHLG